ncbi:MAG: cysteine-rich CWC family protein [Pseudomonadota bacterium]
MSSVQDRLVADTERQTHCPVCSRANACGVAQDGEGSSCWCMATQVSKELVDWLRAQGVDERCLCAECAAGDVPSPCVGMCRLDEAKASCVGCGRLVSEITGWRSRSAVEKAAVLLRLQGSPVAER